MEDNLRDRAEAASPVRPWLYAGLLALAGLAIHFILDGADESGPRAAAAAFIAFAAGTFAFTAERGRWLAPGLFALGTGAIVGGLTWRVVGAAGDLADGGYALAAGVFACLVAVPLFQAGFHRRLFATSFRDVHYAVWTDAITGAGAIAFLGLAWLLIWLVSELLGLVGIPLQDLLEEGWFAAAFSGLVLGAGLGTLRNRLGIIATLQSVVLLVLSILAVPLALSIAVFLLAVAVSGPSVLWNATDSATPVLLSIAISAFLLANATIRDADEEMEGHAVLKGAAFVLALGLLPLTVFAAISTGLRIGQHGLSPERLWALVAVLGAAAYGVAYCIDALIGARSNWRERLRTSNLRLAVATALLALVLALPILDFGAISAQGQIARLRSGVVSVEAFDFAALRWDFGEPGRAALKRLARSDDEAIREGANAALAMKERYRGPFDGRSEQVEPIFQGGSEAERAAVRSYLADTARPYLGEPLTVLFAGRLDEPRGQHVILAGPEGPVLHLLLDDQGEVRSLRVQDGRLLRDDEVQPVRRGPAGTGAIEVRPYKGRQVFIDGKPVGEPFR